MPPFVLVLAALAAAAPADTPAPHAAAWAELTVSGRGLNPTQETWRLGLSGGGTLYVVRTSGSRISPAASVSLTTSRTCPGLMTRMRELPRTAQAAQGPIPAPTDGLDYRLDVISPRLLAGVRGPLHLTGDDVSPLAAWTRDLARTVDRCSGYGRRAKPRRGR